MAVLEAAVLYVADKILAQIIKDEVWYKRVYYLFSPPKTYKTRLTKIIHETIDEFEKTHFYETTNGAYPFYHSQVIFEHLSLFLLFQKGTLDRIKYDLSLFPKIVQPAQKDLEEFYDLFITKTNSEEVLRTRFIDENFKKQIFEVSRTIGALKEVISSVKEDTASVRTSVESLTARGAALVQYVSMGLKRTNNLFANEFKFEIKFKNFGNAIATCFHDKIYVLRKNDDKTIDEQFGTISSDPSKRFQEEFAPGEERTFDVVSNLPGKGTSELGTALFAIEIEYKSEGSDFLTKKWFYYKFNMQNATQTSALSTTSVTADEKMLIENFLSRKIK